MVVMLKGTINGQDITLTRAQGELLEPEYYVELMGGCGCNDCTV